MKALTKSRAVRLSTMIREIRRRKLPAVAAGYTAVAYGVVEVTGNVLAPSYLPESATAVVLVLAAIGFPLTLAAWWHLVPELGLDEEAEAEETTVSVSSSAAAVPGPVGNERSRDGPTRLIVLPLRILRPDPDTEFLASSLPDAVTCSLANLNSLVVRTNVQGTAFGDPPDLAEIATRADVNAVLTGTLLRANGSVRVNVQLAEAPAGTVRWSKSLESPLDDLFKLQDELTQAIVDALALPLTDREQGLLSHDVPVSAHGYELYLRANYLSLEMGGLLTARDLYVQAIEEDPAFAPAWARLGRCYRMLAKYITRAPDDVAAQMKLAEEAFDKALALNPDLPLAQCLYAQLEIDAGRAAEAMARLLARAHVGGSESDIFPGLVHACRYGGLLDASVAAHEKALELNANARTSIAHTYFLQGEYERALEEDLNIEVGYLRAQLLASLGREPEALELLRDREQKFGSAWIGTMLRSLRMLMEGETEEGIPATLEAVDGMADGEGVYYLARQLARYGRPQEAFSTLARAIDLGYHCYPGIARDPWLDGIRSEPRFAALRDRLADGHRRAVSVFSDAGGARILELSG